MLLVAGAQLFSLAYFIFPDGPPLYAAHKCHQFPARGSHAIEITNLTDQ